MAVGRAKSFFNAWNHLFSHRHHLLEDEVGGFVAPRHDQRLAEVRNLSRLLFTVAFLDESLMFLCLYRSICWNMHCLNYGSFLDFSFHWH